MFADRRRSFMNQMGEGVALFYAAPEKIRSNDTHYKFRQDSTFYYLTGFNEPGSAIVLLPGHPDHEVVMFVRPRDRDMEIWNGRRAGPEGVKERFGAQASYTIDKLPEMLAGYLAKTDRFFYGIGRQADRDREVLGVMEGLRQKVRLGLKAPSQMIDPAAILNEMRLHKTAEEAEVMRQACRITSEGHIAAMQAVKPGMYEYQVEALIEQEFRARGAAAPGYGTIAGSGVNATVLHYVENESICRDGELLLVDAGAEYMGYSGDITRTFPVNGKFSAAQRAVYEIVLDAQMKAIAACRPGAGFVDVHNIALRALVEGLVKLGVLKGSVDEIIKNETYKPVYMHRTSHWLGLDVHDVGEYRRGDEDRPLEPGMVLTVEPGLYFTEWWEEGPAEYRGIGIRIEDDVLITEKGHEVLTSVPKTVAEIEAVMAGAPRESAASARTRA
jgi:Xaa-Pro aminopeptidase